MRGKRGLYLSMQCKKYALMFTEFSLFSINHKIQVHMSLFSFVCLALYSLLMYYIYSNKGKSFIQSPGLYERCVHNLQVFLLHYSALLLCVQARLESLITDQYCRNVVQVCVQQCTRWLVVNLLFWHVFLETGVELLPKLEACWGTSTAVKTPYGPISLRFPCPLALPLSVPSSSSTSAQHSGGSILIRPICSLWWEAVALLLAKLSHSPHMTARVMASTSQLGSHELIPSTPNAAQQWSNTIKFKPFPAHLPHVTLEGSWFNKLLNQTTKCWKTLLPRLRSYWTKKTRLIFFWC